MGKTVNLAKFISELNYSKLPTDVIEMSKKCVLDYLGCAIFATQTEMGKIVTDVCEKGNFGNSNIFPSFEGKFDASFAAFANGTLAHGFELDDVNLPSVSHPGAVVISAALALGQEKKVSGERMIEAIVAGYEAMSRVGSTIGSSHVDYGFHPTASHGVFGATAAAAKILDLPPEKIAAAFGLAGSLASGLMQFSLSGTMVKRIHAGKSAQQGIITARLAEKGFTGPTDILEGEYGYCTVFRGSIKKDEVNFDAIDQGLGKHYAIMDTAVKPSPACGCLHAVIECMQNIKEDSAFSPEKATEIIVRGHKNLVEVHNDYAPKSILAAQYSLPFTVGLSMVENIEDPSLYLDKGVLVNEGALRYAKLVRAELDEEIEKQFPEKFGAKVEVRTSDGKVFNQTVYSQKGSAENPFTLNDVKKKYRVLVKTVLDEKRVLLLEEKIMSLDSVSSISDIFKGL